jgi:hypothetical protein
MIRHFSECFATIDPKYDLHRGNGLMSDAFGLRYTTIPLNNGSDEIAAVVDTGIPGSIRREKSTFKPEFPE